MAEPNVDYAAAAALDGPYTDGFSRIYDFASGVIISIGCGIVASKREAHALRSATPLGAVLVNVTPSPLIVKGGNKVDKVIEHCNGLALRIKAATFHYRSNVVVFSESALGEKGLEEAAAVVSIYFRNVYDMHPAHFAYCLDRTRHGQHHLTDVAYSSLCDNHRRAFAVAGLDTRLIINPQLPTQRPFGDVRQGGIGDMQQLPPVLSMGSKKRKSN